MKAGLFPGQGTQRTGMGERFFHLSGGAKAVFSTASEVLERDIAALCFRAPPDVLRDTTNAQVAVVVTGLAAYEVAAEMGFNPDVVAGHSVGELAAIAVAGCLDLPDVLLAVQRRAELMGALPRVGGMAAIGGIGETRLAELCERAAEVGRVGIAVHNSDTNVVVSGDVDGVSAVCDAVRAEGGKATVLEVSHAFHSPLMTPVAAPWAEYLDGVAFRDPKTPVIGNVSGQPLHTAADVCTELADQVVRPVRWADSLRRLSAMGVELAVELGDTRALTGMSRNVTPPLETISLGDPKGLRALAQAVESAQ